MPRIDHGDDVTAPLPDLDHRAPAAAAVADAVKRALRERGSPLVVGIDGRSGAGKSTFGRDLARRLAATLVEGDHFYADLPEHERLGLTPEQGADRYFDWRRMRREALEPLRAGRRARYRPFDWERGGGLVAQPVDLGPAAVIVVEGVYSTRSELADLIDLAVLVEAPDDVRRRRRLARHDPRPWEARWDRAERWYFDHVRPPAAFDVVVDGTDPDAAATTG